MNFVEVRMSPKRPGNTEQDEANVELSRRRIITAAALVISARPAAGGYSPEVHHLVTLDYRILIVKINRWVTVRRLKGNQVIQRRVRGA
jgi:hypothetical protein